MRKLGIILALLLVRLPLLGQSACTSNCGFGPDVPTNVVCSASQTDATMGTCSWSTTQSSDSLVTLVDNFNNAEQWIYDANMTTTHTVALTKLAPNATATYHVSSCTHATFGNIGTVCPMTSPDWSSTGPSHNSYSCWHALVMVDERLGPYSCFSRTGVLYQCSGGSGNRNNWASFWRCRFFADGPRFLHHADLDCC